MSAPANDRPRLAPSARADANDYTFIFGAIRTLGDLRRRLPVVFARSGSARSTPDPPRPIPTEPLTGFEPVTSALPRMRSTTELRQHAPDWPARMREAALWPRPDGLSSADAPAMMRYGTGMTDKSAKDARAERLAAALRANLRKRKGLGDRADPLADQHPSTEPDPARSQRPDSARMPD